MPIGKKITRRKPGTGPPVNYFSADTQQAIADYELETDHKLKEVIYCSRIFPAFKTLVENLISVYGYQVQHESRDDLRSECIEFLQGVLPKFNPAKGSKAFSYFNVVAKNWLTIKSKQNSKNVQMFSSLDNRESFSLHDMEVIENYHVLPAPDEVVTQEEEAERLENLLFELRDYAKTDNEKVCVEAIATLFSNAEDLDFVNKRAVMLYIREITKLSSKQLSIVLGNLKKYYREAKQILDEV